MKRIILIAFLSIITSAGFAQRNAFIGVYGGGGLATSYNYDVAASGGIEYLFGLFNRTAFGATVFYQKYGLAVDNEANGAKNGSGSAGLQLLHQSSYVFVAPKLIHGFGKGEFLNFFVNAGMGFNMGGTETVHKWDHSFGAGVGNYDSVVTTTANINKMIFRVGVGFIEYLHLSNKWWFTITEDFGFLAQGLSSTGEVTDPSRTSYSPSKLNPAFISLQIGITHSKY